MYQKKNYIHRSTTIHECQKNYHVLSFYMCASEYLISYSLNLSFFWKLVGVNQKAGLTVECGEDMLNTIIAIKISLLIRFSSLILFYCRH